MKIYTTLLLLFTLSCGEVKPVVVKQVIKKEQKLARNEVKLTKRYSNTFEVTVDLNNSLKIPCILDSGASEVSLPPYIIYTLIKIGSIKESDHLPSKNYSLANGDVVTNPRFLIRELKIGDYILKDIECSVSESELSPILLGSNVLSRFKKVTIDYQKEILILEK